MPFLLTQRRALSLQSDPNLASRPFDAARDGFVGTGGGIAKGIYRYEFEPATGKLTNGELAAEVAKGDDLPWG